MKAYNDQRTAFSKDFDRYLLPADQKKASWLKRYVKIPKNCDTWWEYISPEERDRLLEIHDKEGYGAYVLACEYLHEGTWWGRYRDIKETRRQKGKIRFEEGVA